MMRNPHDPPQSARCQGVTRRSFLADTGMGFTGLVLGSMLFRDGVAHAAPASQPSTRERSSGPHFPPKAKSVIWIFLCGGVSHVETFDVKPALNTYAGKRYEETPFKDVLDPRKLNANIIGGNPRHTSGKEIMPLQCGYQAYGQCGLLVGDWFANVGRHADDIAVVRSLWTNHNDHGAQLTFHTGRHPRETGYPTIGAWSAYGLGTLNENLPEYVVLGDPTNECCGGAWTYGAGYLGPQHSGVRLDLDPQAPLPFMRPANDSVGEEEQASAFSFLGRLNHLSGIDYPEDAQLRARIKAYELAFLMQSSVPESLAVDRESEATKKLYGIDDPVTRPFGEQCVAARRLVERGVRFVQLAHAGKDIGWDSHGNIKKNHGRLSAAVDRPIAGLLADLKQRGMLDETLVVWATEFGRTPGAEGTGRDHHPQGFSAWLAGGGIKGGVQHGATDELGFHAVQDPHFVTDIHATVLHQLGLDSRRMEIPGRKRLEADHGHPITGILA